MVTLLELFGPAGILILPIVLLGWWAFGQAQEMYAEWRASNDFDEYDPDPPKEPLKIPDECGDFLLAKVGPSR